MQVGQLLGDKFEVTALARSPDHSHLAVGYRDGYVRVFDVHSGESECSIIFHGHRRAVTALAYDHDGMRLVSGSQVSLCVCVYVCVCVCACVFIFVSVSLKQSILSFNLYNLKLKR